MVKPFSNSKRTPVRLRHRIEKASAAKQRKQRKEAKSNPQWKSRLKKDPGIPNLFPFKDKILAEIEEKKRAKAEDAQRIRDAARAKKSDSKNKDTMEEELEDQMSVGSDDLIEADMDLDEDDDASNPMAALLASAQARAVEFDGSLEGEEESEDDEEDWGDMDSKLDSTPSTTNYKNPDSSRRAFDKIFKQVVEAADVILYVLDARDPEGTRSKEVERQIMAAESGSKRLILVLNKIDLLPPAVLKAWLLYLRRYFPTIPLQASTPASNAHTFNHKQLTVKGTSETLLRALKSYAAAKQLKRSISVGVIGYPNVGKSSVINALTSRLNKGLQRSACPVGSEAGVTTSLREVKIDNKLKLLDSPGIVFPSTNPSNPESNAKETKSDIEARLVLLNALPPKQISDPVPAVTLLLSRLASSTSLYEKLLQTYGITAIGPFSGADTTTNFLVEVARKRGRLGKGGVPNLYSAAMAVITDWRDGRIQGWMEAPNLQGILESENGGKGGPRPGEGGVDQKEIVKEWAQEFKLEGLWGDGAKDDEDMKE